MSSMDWSPPPARTTAQQTVSRRRFLHGLGCGCALAVTACTENRATGRSSFTGLYSIEDDIALGRQEHPKLVAQFGGEYEDARLQSYVDRIGFKLADYAEYDFPYTFTIVNSPIVNAFALPGGYVYLSRGLLTLASTEAEVASVVAHEIGHVTARHSAERISRAQIAQLGAGLLGIAVGSGQIASLAGQAAGLAIQSYSREQELEADKLGMRYMSRAGYDPQGSVDFLSTLREQSMLEAEMRGMSPGSVDEFNMMATHPRTIERVQLARAQAETVDVPNPIVGRDAHLTVINGVLFGDDPDEGLIEDQTFVHRALRFEFSVPPGFTLRNGTQRVVAVHEDGSGIIFDMARAPAGMPMPRFVSEVWAGNTRVSDLQPLQINGMQAATAVARVNGRSGPLTIRLLAIRGDGEEVFRMLFVTPQAQTSAHDVEFRRTTYSFRRLTPEEAAAIQGKRLIVAPIVEGDTIAALASTMPFDEYNERAFRVLNDLGPNDPLPRQGVAKIVAS